MESYGDKSRHGRYREICVNTGDNLAAPQGFEPRYADPELMDRLAKILGSMLKNQALTSNSSPARKHFDGTEKARFSSQRIEAYGTFMAHFLAR
jgi:hypothetical protein